MRTFGESETAGEKARRRDNGSKTRRKKRGSCSTDNRDWDRSKDRSSSGEYKQKVTAGAKYSPFGSCDAEDESLQAWVEHLLKTPLARDRKKDASERQSMKQEDSNFQTTGMGEDVGTASPRLAPGN